MCVCVCVCACACACVCVDLHTRPLEATEEPQGRLASLTECLCTSSLQGLLLFEVRKRRGRRKRKKKRKRKRRVEVCVNAAMASTPGPQRSY